jgi:hypothetical protein
MNPTARLTRLERAAAKLGPALAPPSSFTDELIESLPSHVRRAFIAAFDRQAVVAADEEMIYLNDLDMPDDLRAQLADAVAFGTWRGDWLEPVTERPRSLQPNDLPEKGQLPRS